MKTLVVALVALTILLCACRISPAPQANMRTYRMGFANSGPGVTPGDFLTALEEWPSRADAAIISTEVPWDSLLGGVSAVNYVVDNYSQLVAYYRSKNLKLWIYIDPENGLNRASDSEPLVQLGKSIAQTPVQLVYRRFVVVMDSIFRPDHLGLALETNLIRFAAPDSIYQGVVAATAGAAQDIRAVDANVPLSVSVQAEVSWGKLQGTAYQGVSQDFKDFPFIQELGISSYPYLSFPLPSDIPDGYYAMLTGGRSIPVFVSEGGWTSKSFAGPSGPITSSPQIQAAYIRRQAQLLAEAKAIGLFQLTYTDIAISAYSGLTQQELSPFIYIGLVDTAFNPKPALNTWDSLYATPYM